MSSIPLVLSIGGVAVVALCALVASTLRTRRSAELDSHRSGTIWRRGYHLAAELLAGRATAANSADLVEFIDQTSEPMTVAASLAVATRQEPHETHVALRTAVGRSRLPKILRARLNSGDPHQVIEALEIVEVLRVQTLLGDAAALTLHRDPRIIRAACDAVVEIDPATGLGVLIGLVDICESWVLDSIGRATTTLNTRGGYNGPLSQAQWGNAPMLARRVLDESALHDRATVGDAVATLIRSLDDPSAAKRLAAVTALSSSIDHPAAQLALAGALGSSDRMTRYAVAASLSDSVVGRQILRRTAAEADGSDAARMAAEILWSGDSHEREVQLHAVAS